MEKFRVNKFFVTRELESRKKFNKGISALLISVLFIAAYWAHTLQIPFLTCRFNALTGLPCPTCGMTRAFHAMVHLNPLQAVHYNPLGAILFIILASMLFSFYLQLILNREIAFKPGFIKFRILVTGFLVIWIIYWIVKMLS